MRLAPARDPSDPVSALVRLSLPHKCSRIDLSTRASRDNESIVASDLTHARLLRTVRCAHVVRLDALRELKRGGAGAMSKDSSPTEQPETRSQRRIYDQGTGPEKRYVYTVLSAPGGAIGRAWREELRSKHGN